MLIKRIGGQHMPTTYHMGTILPRRERILPTYKQDLFITLPEYLPAHTLVYRLGG